MQALKTAVLRYAATHADGDGLARTPIEGLRMMRAFAPCGPLHSIYRPLACFILQGAKQLDVAGDARTFGAGQAVVVTVDAPVTGRIVRASPAEPYIAVAVELQMAVLRELGAQMRLRGPTGSTPGLRLFAEDSDAATLDCATRLVRLLDRIDDAPLLAPGILHELHYWLLAGRHGPRLRELALPDNAAQRLLDAVRILRSDFRGAIRVEDLAAVSHMSTATFHKHFKAMTSLTPVQFHKQLRLIEARRLMVDEGKAAGIAADQVGYGSVSQFTREYARMFGAPPATHVRLLAASASA